MLTAMQDTASTTAAATSISSGLSSHDAAQRLHRDGPNALATDGRRGILAIIADTAREPMFLLLLAAGTLYLLFGEAIEGVTLFAAVLIMLGLTLYQEGKTERALEALRDLTSPRARVIRDGQAQRIAGRDVVAGDVLLLAEGDRVPADAILIEGHDLMADESLLTGEPVPVRKITAPDAPAAATGTPTPGGDDQPHIYSGTLIVQGQGMARVTATGPRSAIGRIGTSLATLAVERSPLQMQTTALVRNLAVLAVCLSLVLVGIYGLLRGDWLQALLAGIALAMALLPEEYPVVMTVFPALGAWRLSKEKVLTRRITAIETLGATSVLCADKTGTLARLVGKFKKTGQADYQPQVPAPPAVSGERLAA